MKSYRLRVRTRGRADTLQCPAAQFLQYCQDVAAAKKDRQLRGHVDDEREKQRKQVNGRMLRKSIALVWSLAARIVDMPS